MDNITLQNSIPFTFKRWFMLGITSIVLCLSFILTVFTPYPIALTGIFFGRVKGYLLMGVNLFLMGIISYFFDKSVNLFMFYLAGVAFATIVMETVLRNIRPIKAIVISGLAIILLFSGTFSIAYFSGGFHPKEFVVQKIVEQTNNEEIKKELLNSTDKGAIDIAALLNEPEVLAEQILKPFPSYFVISVFLILWVNLYLVLRSRRLIFMSVGKKVATSEKELMKFTVPDYFIWAVIISLVLSIFGKDLFGSIYYEVIGTTLLSGFGIFYFFQGLYIFLDFLTSWRIFGFFRMLIVMVSIVMISWAFALIGLFDSFFNFRRFIKKIES